MTKKSKNEKAIDMFVQQELMERLLQLHRHSFIPYRLAKFRGQELSKKSRATRNLYLREVKRVVKANRNFIDQYLDNRTDCRRETMDMLYAMRVHAMN